MFRGLPDLGLTKDDRAARGERVALWDNFNNCWLALLQRQLDDTQRMLDTGRSPAPPRILLPLNTLERMGDELVAHCDNLGKLGLVDYQMGVAEEEIVESRLLRSTKGAAKSAIIDLLVVLNRCIDLLRNSDDENEPEESLTVNQPPREQKRSNR